MKPIDKSKRRTRVRRDWAPLMKRFGFVSGMAQVGILYPAPVWRFSPHNDAAAMASDWYAVGDDMRASIAEYQSKQRK